MKELRHHIQLLFCLCLWMALPFTQVRGQNTSNEFVEEMHLLEIENRMLNFYQELKNISAKIGQYTSDELTEVDKQVTAIDTKWNTYYQAQQIIIAEDDSLLQIAANYQLAKQNLLDSIALQNISSKARRILLKLKLFFRRRTILTLNFMKRHLNTRW